MKWISAKDRLPEKNVNVLIHAYVVGIGSKKVWKKNYYVAYVYSSEEWVIDCECVGGESWAIDRIEIEITHWMPLPEPPEDEEC